MNRNTRNSDQGKFLIPIILMTFNMLAVLWAHDHQYVWTWFAFLYGAASTAACAVWSYALLKRYNIGLAKKG